MDSSDDDKPIISRLNGASKNGTTQVKRSLPVSPDSDSDDAPLSKRLKSSGKASVEESKPSKAKALKRKKPPIASSDEDVPLAASDAAKSVAIPMPGATSARNGRAVKSGTQVKQEDSDDDQPLATKAKSRVKAEPESDSTPQAKGKRQPPKKKRKVSQSSVEENGSSDDEKPPPKTKRGKVKSEVTDSPAKPKVDKEKKLTKKELRKQQEEAEEAEMFKWWEKEGMEGDGTEKWQTLEHNGPLFPPPYEPLPSHVKMKYEGKGISLPPEAEEVAGFFGAMLETDYATDSVFQENFFKDWTDVLKEHPPLGGVKIKSFDKCDFRPMFEYFEAEKVKKKAMKKTEKEQLKKDREELEEKYTTCLLDGRTEKVGSFRVEPPGLFRGRGKHPKKGCLKLRVKPEDMVINLSEGAPIPKPNIPGEWGKLVHDNTVTWLANWKENVNGQFKYVYLAAGSSLKGQSDMSKFEKARELKQHVDRIRQDYTAELKSKVTAERQRATAMYFIDILALRAGNEKGEDEADTVGCCSLRYEHVMLTPPNLVTFDFLGKDSIRYKNTVPVPEQVFKNIRIFKGNGKTDGDDLFDRLTPTILNKHLQSYMKGLSAKVFRTFNASLTFQQQLDQNTPEDASVPEKLLAYNQANRMVAILCNHQKSVAKTHDASMEKMKTDLLITKWERMKFRHALFAQNSKMKKTRPDLLEDESDIDDDAVIGIEESWKSREIAKANNKYEREKRAHEEDSSKKEPDGDVRDNRIKEIEAEFQRFIQERGTGKATLKASKTDDKLLEVIAKHDEKIKNQKIQMRDKDEGKTVSLGTSKINYLDPRITAAWCKKHEVDIEKIFNKSLLKKFPWAKVVDKDWKF